MWGQLSFGKEESDRQTEGGKEGGTEGGRGGEGGGDGGGRETCDTIETKTGCKEMGKNLTSRDCCPLIRRASQSDWLERMHS